MASMPSIYTVKRITKILHRVGIDLPREHNRMIALIANATSARLAFQCAAEMWIGRQTPISRKKKS